MSAQQLAAHIASACVDLNLDETDDDITVLVIKLCERAVTNLMIGPPSQMEKDEAFLKLFLHHPESTLCAAEPQLSSWQTIWVRN
ncbi:hypothetical protein LC724_06645 [Blautia sp. RD014234]|nr:hypothetical protein [Blautia parvula]